MKFIDRPYYGERVKRKGSRLIKKIRKGSFFTGAYVLCLPESSTRSFAGSYHRELL